MSRKFKIIYLCCAPLLFGISYLISQRIVPRAQAIGTGKIDKVDPQMSLMYAGILTTVYLLAFLAMLDMYRKK